VFAETAPVWAPFSFGFCGVQVWLLRYRVGFVIYTDIPVIDRLRVFYDEDFMTMKAISIVTYCCRLI